MSVLDRSALESSPLADLHAIASELGLDSFRRLRKADLIDAILARQGGEEAPAAGGDDSDEEPARPRRSRSRRGAASRDADDEAPPRRRRARAASDEEDDAPEESGATDEDAGERPARSRRSRGGRGRGGGGGGGRGRGRDRDEDSGDSEPREREAPEDEEERVAEGTIELLGNGSGFVRVSPPEPSDDDVYVSAAQVRRCELVGGDVVSGPVRRPRRSERFPSLVRVDTINGRPADEVAEGTRYDDLPSSFPTERIELPGDDPTLQAIAWLTPFGKGSRVTIAGGARAGKTEALRRLAGALSTVGGLTVTVVLAGVRPEEVPEWESGPVAPTASVTMAGSGDSQAQAVEQAVEQARRLAARGGDAVVLIDGLDGLSPAAARRALAAARNLVDGGSLTVIATATQPVGGETTTIVLHPALAAARTFPALDLASSGTMKAELLVGEQGVEAIARARAETLGG
ncbi:MAG: transcription termination factor Rho [Solirubrobacteraceae bacterium]|jgi:transcription termination factor Rho|nr:transcription termination factor Rho [Solirubrobacteraceae bacterium]